MSDANAKHWGYQLSKQSGVRSGVMYPLLSRMLDQGWLEDGWEEADPRQKKRPPRRYYTLTNQGRIELGAVLNEARADRRFTGHSSPSVTLNTYAHLWPNANDRTRKAAANLFQAAVNPTADALRTDSQ